MSFDWKSLVGTVAPTIATALGGPLAGMAVKAVGDALGLDNATEATVSAALQGASPDTLLKLKQADQDFAVKMRDLDIKVDDIEARDRDSARQREAKVGDKTARNLAYLVVGAFIGVVASTLAGWNKVDSVLAGTLIGYLSAKAEQVIAYYFGSSHGSKGKDDTIKALSK